MPFAKRKLLRGQTKSSHSLFFLLRQCWEGWNSGMESGPSARCLCLSFGSCFKLGCCGNCWGKGGVIDHFRRVTRRSFLVSSLRLL